MQLQNVEREQVEQQRKQQQQYLEQQKTKQQQKILEQQKQQQQQYLEHQQKQQQQLENLKQRQEQLSQQRAELQQQEEELRQQQPSFTGMQVESGIRQHNSASQEPILVGSENQVIRGFSMPSFVQDSSHNNGGMLFNSMNSSSLKNKFLPPGIGKKELKLIENSEFVDFEDLLPGIAPTAYTKNDHTIDIDQVSSTLKLAPKNKQGRIFNLSHWMVAWNRFMEAKLSFKPHMFFELFKYQQHMCEFAAKYKFEACYLYDINFRLALAAQQSIDPAQRSVTWAEINKEFESRHLMKSAMLSVCDHCHCTGHIEIYCPLKKKSGKPKNKSMSSDYSQEEYSGDQFRNAAETSARSSNTNREFFGVSETNRRSSRDKLSSGNVDRRCFRYNRGEVCTPPCYFEHLCNKCGEPHPGHLHNEVTTTKFVPRRR